MYPLLSASPIAQTPPPWPNGTERAIVPPGTATPTVEAFVTQLPNTGVGVDIDPSGGMVWVALMLFGILIGVWMSRRS